MMNEIVRFGTIHIGRTSASADEAQENSWILASQSGDTQAFNRLVLKWEKRVYNLALRMLRDSEEAAEATQESFLLAFRNIRRFRRDSKFSTWLYRIAVNHCINRMNQRPPGTHLSLDSDKELNPARELRFSQTQDGDLIRSEQRRKVLAALSHLSSEQQVVVELKFFQELTLEEIAAVLGIPLSTVKTRLYSGLEMLKSRLRTPMI